MLSRVKPQSEGRYWRPSLILHIVEIPRAEGVDSGEPTAVPAGRSLPFVGKAWPELPAPAEDPGKQKATLRNAVALMVPTMQDAHSRLSRQ